MPALKPPRGFPGHVLGRSSGGQWLDKKRPSDESSHYWEMVETGGQIESGGNFGTLIQKECLVKMTSVDLLLLWRDLS